MHAKQDLQPCFRKTKDIPQPRNRDFRRNSNLPAACDTSIARATEFVDCCVVSYDAIGSHKTPTYYGNVHFVHVKKHIRYGLGFLPYFTIDSRAQDTNCSNQVTESRQNIRSTQSNKRPIGHEATHSNRPTSRPCSKPFTLNVLSLRQFSSWFSTLNLAHAPREMGGTYMR